MPEEFLNRVPREKCSAGQQLMQRAVVLFLVAGSILAAIDALMIARYATAETGVERSLSKNAR
ncbi:MAG: hypothetical protein HYZ37_17025 [Candidatus Solibacter usitatus]|nr:hypothetical protein [Candidatus Solibacter usitatus]